LPAPPVFFMMQSAATWPTPPHSEHTIEFTAFLTSVHYSRMRYQQRERERVCVCVCVQQRPEAKTNFPPRQHSPQATTHLPVAVCGRAAVLAPHDLFVAECAVERGKLTQLQTL
jgi:hypothetical protein